MKTESRTFQAEGLEVRQLDGKTPTIVGYAIAFDGWSEVMSDSRGRKFRERFAPASFDRVLASGADVRALWNHNDDYPLGRTKNGTLRLSKDRQGVRFELTPPATSWGADAVEAIRSGIVNGMSFAFVPTRDGGDTWSKPGRDGVAERTVLDADLLEVSPVTYPAYPQTSVMVRSIEVPEFESTGRAADEIAHEEQQRALRLRVQVEHELIQWGTYEEAC